ncbi:pyridine nucleotide-disulfide oxidoreductase [Streptomyces sp. BK022]|uniref:FAD-dependent oxidoreductase n=1 Tax=Streptomyces sp. BK022 TaxID=2512123 RepID=UPI0010DA7F6F|nr:FAD-dependent oxidoreductase [Streptomyces sp. BK022]RZU36411.1 pyridine nucleotide-disulfide oxidoreductase [Streptomyces sp. BK022]
MTQSWSGQRDRRTPLAAQSGRSPVVVIGAGPYGLSVAAHLRAQGVRVRVFGEVMGSWRHAMATGMFLKSTPDATDLSAPVAGATLADYCRARGQDELTELTPIPCTTFVAYGQWFADRHAGEVEESRVTSVERGPAGFVVRVEGGEECAAQAVVVATGLSGLAHVPGQFRALAPGGPHPDGLVSHTSQHQDLARYAGQRVAVIGGGQSALESAALLHEARAIPTVLVRENRVLWGEPPELGRPLAHRVVSPSAALGTGWSLLAVSRAPGAVRRLPSAARMYLFRRALGPSGGWWLRERVEGIVPVRTGCHVDGAEADRSGGALLRLSGRVPGALSVDHVLAATGYRLDLERLPFLSASLRREVRRAKGSAAPHLSAAFESSVPRLYFTGSLTAPCFGPVMRFVAGTAFAATRISRHLTLGAARL